MIIENNRIGVFVSICTVVWNIIWILQRSPLTWLVAVTHADLVYPEMLNTRCQCSISFIFASSVVQRICARWWRVRITPSLCWRGWLLSNWRYLIGPYGWAYGIQWMKDASSPRWVLTSSMGKHFSSSSFSRVNLISGWIELKYVENSSKSTSSIATPVSSTYRFHSCSSALKVARACSSNHSMNKFATIGPTGEPMAAPSTWM